MDELPLQTLAAVALALAAKVLLGRASPTPVGGEVDEDDWRRRDPRDSTIPLGGWDGDWDGDIG